MIPNSVNERIWPGGESYSGDFRKRSLQILDFLKSRIDPFFLVIHRYPSLQGSEGTDNLLPVEFVSSADAPVKSGSRVVTPRFLPDETVQRNGFDQLFFPAHPARRIRALHVLCRKAHQIRSHSCKLAEKFDRVSLPRRVHDDRNSVPVPHLYYLLQRKNVLSGIRIIWNHEMDR